MFPVGISAVDVNHDIPQEDVGTPGVRMGEKVTGSSIRDPWGLRKYMYIQNLTAAALVKYDAVSQVCVNDFGTEGTLLTGDANAGGTKVIDDDAHGAAASYTDETNYFGFKWCAPASSTASTSVYTGEVLGNDVNQFNLVQAAPAAVGAVVYGIYKPWAMKLANKNTNELIWGVVQSAIPAGDFGWMQVWGFGIAHLINSTNSIATAFGEALAVSTGTDGGLMGLTTGTDDSNRCGVALFTSTDATGFYAPIFMENMVGGW
jgi:hypothetical protein